MSQQGKKNIYFCKDCGHGVVTLDVDDGVTPFMIECDRCGSSAYSFFYRAPQEMLDDITPAFDWYRPSVVENLSPSSRAHVDRGGLLKRIHVKQPTAGVSANAHF